MPSQAMRYPVEPFRPRGNEAGTPAPQQQESRNGNGNGRTPGNHNPNRHPPRRPPVVNASETYVHYNAREAERFFAQQNSHWPHQLNGHGGHWAPGANGFGMHFPPHPNGNGDPSFMNGGPFFRPHTAPPPDMFDPGAQSGRWRSISQSSPAPFHPPPPPPPFFEPGSHGYYPDYQHPAYSQYNPYPAVEFTPMHPPSPWMYPAQPCYSKPKKLDDPEAKLFIGDLPVRMTTEELYHALKETFSPFGECKVNVIWKIKRGPQGVEKSLPTGWIQYKTLFDAAKALDVNKESGFVIGNRAVRVDRADGKRICRMWPTHPYARPRLEDFKDTICQFIQSSNPRSEFRVMCHVSDEIEMVEKNYGGQLFTVPSVGVVFRWVEDANISQNELHAFTPHFRLKVEHVNSSMPGWREGPVSWELFDSLTLDTGEKWQEDLTRSRRCLRDHGETFPLGEMARYPERISKKLIPRSILEHPRLKKDIFGFEPLEWLDLHQEPPTALAMAINSRKAGQVNGQSNGESSRPVNGDSGHHANGESCHQASGDPSHQANGEANDQTNGDFDHQANSQSNHQENGQSDHQENGEINDQANDA